MICTYLLVCIDDSIMDNALEIRQFVQRIRSSPYTDADVKQLCAIVIGLLPQPVLTKTVGAGKICHHCEFAMPNACRKCPNCEKVQKKRKRATDQTRSSSAPPAQPELEENDCQVCGNNVEAGKLDLACGHVFHLKCLQNYVKFSQKKHCFCCEGDDKTLFPPEVFVTT